MLYTFNENGLTSRFRIKECITTASAKIVVARVTNLTRCNRQKRTSSMNSRRKPISLPTVLQNRVEAQIRSPTAQSVS
jgi:hypothetical protein